MNFVSQNLAFLADLILLFGIAIILYVYYAQRKMRDVHTVDDYLANTRNAVWNLAMNKLHKLRNQEHATIVKTNNVKIKSKQAYMYSWDFLKRDLSKTLGIYGHNKLPDYLQLWREWQNIADDTKDSNVVKSMLDWLDKNKDCQIFYVYYDLDKKMYVWCDMAQAANNPKVPMQDQARFILLAAETLNLYLVPNNEMELEVVKSFDQGDIVLMNTCKDIYVKALWNKQKYDFNYMQVYDDKESSKFVCDGKDLITLDSLFDNILANLKNHAEIAKTAKQEAK